MLGMGLACGDHVYSERELEVNTLYKLNRGQIAVVLLSRIFEMDNDELSDIFQMATGHGLLDARTTSESGDEWECDRDFTNYCHPDQHRILDYLRSQLPPAR
jgi:hypothetical protein